MDFAEIKDANPHFLCICGHPAADHLYCGDHVCVSCQRCKGFELDDSVENILIAVRGVPEHLD